MFQNIKKLLLIVSLSGLCGSCNVLSEYLLGDDARNDYTKKSNDYHERSNWVGEGLSCNQYQYEYSTQLLEVMKRYDDYDRAKKTGAGEERLEMLKKALVVSQKKLIQIRQSANADGCSVSKSQYETDIP